MILQIENMYYWRRDGVEDDETKEHLFWFQEVQQSEGNSWISQVQHIIRSIQEPIDNVMEKVE